MLIGTLPAPVTSAPLVILIYVVLILMVASAVASVVLRNALYAVAAFAATMLLVAILYLTIAPFLLFAVQLLIVTVLSVLLLLVLLRDSTGLQRATIGPFGRQSIIGAAVSAALLALIAVIVGATNWPNRICCSLPASFGGAVTNEYVVGLVTIIILIGSAAVGTRLLLRSAPSAPQGGGRRADAGRGRDRRERERR